MEENKLYIWLEEKAKEAANEMPKENGQYYWYFEGKRDAFKEVLEKLKETK